MFFLDLCRRVSERSVSVLALFSIATDIRTKTQLCQIYHKPLWYSSALTSPKIYIVFLRGHRSPDGAHMDAKDTFFSLPNLMQLFSQLWKRDFSSAAGGQAARRPFESEAKVVISVWGDHYGKSTGASVLWGEAKFTRLAVCLFPFSPFYISLCFWHHKRLKFFCVWWAVRGFKIPLSSLYSRPLNEPWKRFCSLLVEMRLNDNSVFISGDIFHYFA